MLVLLWLALIASGASTTGAIRTPQVAAWIPPLTYRVHAIAGAVLGLLAIGAIVRVRPRRAAAWIGSTLVAGSIVLGWLASRSFAPAAGAAHAAVAAWAAVGVWAAAAAHPRDGSPADAPVSVPAWIGVTARVGFVLLGVQAGMGALLRHQQIGLEWHLLVGGLAVLAVLVASTAMQQTAGLPGAARRTARQAVVVVVVQVGLGAAVWLMMLVGPPSTAIWLAATIAHVTVGTMTLLATARLALLRS